MGNYCDKKQIQLLEKGERGGTFKLSKLPFSSVSSNVLNKLLPAMLLVFFSIIYFQILTDNYFNLNRLVIVSFSLSLFRFDYNLWFIIVAFLLSFVSLSSRCKALTFLIIIKTLLTIYW